MTFGAVSFAVGLMLLTLAGLVVIGLYLLRPPPARLVVPSVEHWRRIAERQRSSDLLRRMLSALVSLLIVWSIVSAVTELRLGRQGDETLLLVIDDSATMAARTASGATRLQRARDRAGDLASSWPGRTLLTTTSGRSGALLAEDPIKAGDWLDDLTVHVGSEPRLPDPELGSPARRVLITDGVGLNLDLPSALDFEVHSVFEPARNVGITGLDARERSGGGWEVPVEITNGSLTSERVDLAIETAEGETLLTRELELASGDVWSARLELGSGLVGRELHARISSRDGADALPDDDLATTPLGQPARVVVHHTGSEVLTAVLAAMPEVELATARDEARGAAKDEALRGVTILEGRAPEQRPATPTLLIAPPPRSWLPPRSSAAAVAPRLEELSTRSGGRWAGLDIEEMIEFDLVATAEATQSRAASSDRAEVLLSATTADESDSENDGDGPAARSIPLAFLLTAEDGAAPIGVVAFDVASSSAPFEDGFPLLLSELVHRLGDPGAAGPEGSDAGTSPIRSGATARSTTLINHTAIGPADLAASSPSDSQSPDSPPPSGLGASVLAAALEPRLLLLIVLALLILESVGRQQGVTE